MWSESIELYCERTDPSFWAELVNALTNIAFLIAAYAGYRRWRRDAAGDGAILALVIVAAAVGFGSFALHTLATRGAMMLDVGAIGVFIYGYILLALRRFLALSWPVAIVVLIAFMVLSTALAVYVRRSVLDGSTSYFPALAALFVIGRLKRGSALGRALLMAGCVFTVSITLRIIDLPICGTFPVGTHFLWHILNALVIYLVLAGAIAERRASGTRRASAC